MLSGQEHCHVSPVLALLDISCLCYVQRCAMWQGSTLEYRFEPALIVCNGPAGQVTVFESSEVGEEAFVMRR